MEPIVTALLRVSDENHADPKGWSRIKEFLVLNGIDKDLASNASYVARRVSFLREKQKKEKSSWSKAEEVALTKMLEKYLQ